jgi:hypothetical protein
MTDDRQLAEMNEERHAEQERVLNVLYKVHFVPAELVIFLCRELGASEERVLDKRNSHKD